RAVYSAVEDRLYIAGWAHGWRSLSVGADALVTELFEAPGDGLRGLTYDVLSRWMFTLEITYISEESQIATIVGHDPTTGSSKEIWSVPYAGAFDRLALAADRSGSLMLIGSGSSG